MRADAGIALICLGVASGSFAQEIRQQSWPIVYDADDRKEVFEVAPDLRRRIEESVVVLLPNTALTAEGELASDVQSIGELANLCADEPFAQQPSAAFCSGVLIDWDLVLTASHCMRLLALDEISVVFGYGYTSSGTLPSLGAENVRGLAEIVVEELRHETSDLSAEDFAIVRLSSAAPHGRKPAPIRRRTPRAGDTLFAVGASFGLPLKADVSATIKRIGDKVFAAAADVSQGASGGPTFDAELALVGILATGGRDLEDDAGCNRSREVSAADAQEVYTLASVAAASLCLREEAADTPLCRAECEDPCDVGPRAAAGPRCTASPRAGAPWWPWCFLGLLAVGRARRKTGRK